MKTDIYLYGQVLMTRSLLLKHDFPKLDTYGELERKYYVTGGETGTCATVLESLGCACRLDGNYLGRLTKQPIYDFYAGKNIDLSLMYYDETFDGEEDCVIIDRNTRTCFGQFGAYFDDPIHRWRTPTAPDLAGCKTAAIDPFFPTTSDDVARLCVSLGIPYVTIDCPWDGYLHQHSAINAVSNEYISGNYAGEDRAQVFERFKEASDGLTIFTLGSKDILYGRKGQETKHFTPYRVQVESTLGAGDTFKAGCVYALHHGMSDEETVSFAAATAASACMKYPIPLHPPTLERVRAVQAGKTTL